MRERAGRAYLLCTLVVIFYSGNILIGKALNDLPPFTIAFLRLVIAFLVLLPLTYRSAWQSRSAFRAHRTPLLILTLTGVTFFNTFIYSALQFTSSTNVSVLEAAIPAVTVVLSVWLLHERLRPSQWLGVALSLCGALWVVMDGALLRLASIDWNVGDAIMVGATLSWACYSIAARSYMPLFPARGVLLVMTGASVVILLPIVLVEWTLTGVPALDVGAHWLGLAYLGVFPSVVALLFYNHAVAVLGASRASAFLNFLPVVTMLGAYLWLGETITGVHVIGAAVVIVGVFCTTRPGRRPLPST